MTMIFPHPIRCSYLQVVGCMTFVCLNTPSDDLDFFTSLGTGYSRLCRYVALFALLAFAS
jgi:hypothetical protein